MKKYIFFLYINSTLLFCLISILIFRINLLRGTASLISAFLHPNGVHGLIAGTDKELGYWDLTTGLEFFISYKD